MAETKISDIIQKSLEEIKSIVDANTIIGEMIQTPNGTAILPVSKVSVGLASGGLDYLGKNAKEAKAGQMNFGGGGGTGLTVVPVAFLIIKPSGDVEMLSVSNPMNVQNDLGSNINSLLDKTPDILSKIKAIFSKKTDKSEEDASDSDEEQKEEAALETETDEFFTS